LTFTTTALERTGTWDFVLCSQRVRSTTCKCVYKVKTRSDSSLERYKVYLVARGFQQDQGHDYDDTFAHVAHMTTIHTLLAVTSIREWSISELDMKIVFLNCELREDVYMRPSPGYSVLEGMVCHIRRSLYDLKWAPRAWFPRTHDPALFVHVSPHGRTLLLLYVDDMIITGNDPKYIAFVKVHLSD
jgi:hypothetical protein